jgi:hypothetical protein
MIFEKIETAKEIYHSIKCENVTSLTSIGYKQASPLGDKLL